MLWLVLYWPKIPNPIFGIDIEQKPRNSKTKKRRNIVYDNVMTTMMRRPLTSS